MIDLKSARTVQTRHVGINVPASWVPAIVDAARQAGVHECDWIVEQIGKALVPSTHARTGRGEPVPFVGSTFDR